MSNKRNTTSLGIVMALLALSVGTSTHAQSNLMTPVQYLASQPCPNFAPGNALPKLTRWGWCLSSNATVELATDWGYELTLSGYATPNIISNLTIPGTFEYGMAQLVNANPSKYKLSLLLDRSFTNPPDDFYVTNSSGQFVDASLDTWYPTNNPNKYSPVISPEGDYPYWTNSTLYWMGEISKIEASVHVDIMLNGGEAGLGVPATQAAAWGQDPRVQAATNAEWATITNQDANPWANYGSNRKVWELDLESSAITNDFPNRSLYIYYSTYDESTRYYEPAAGWLNWEYNWGFNSMTGSNVTDLPSYQAYYQGFAGANWTNNAGAPGIGSFNYDLLTMQLDCVGFHLKFGQPLSYNWVCSGWNTNVAAHSSIPLYMGFLKCAYTAGMIGGVAGCFTYPTAGFDASFPSNSPPDWLCQMQALSQVHALFTHEASFLTNSYLLPGPYHHATAWDQPAYEFTSRVGLGSNDRVLVRQLNNSNLWLACAWAADGIDTNVTVTIPTLGSVTLLARDCGAVYQLTTTNATLIDVNGLLPTAPPPAPQNLRIIAANPIQVVGYETKCWFLRTNSSPSEMLAQWNNL